jgi:hypothetical protein
MFNVRYVELSSIRAAPASTRGSFNQKPGFFEKPGFFSPENF